MIGLWLTILFVIIPGAAGAAIAYALNRDGEINRKWLAIGAGIGVVLGVTAGLLLFRY